MSSERPNGARYLFPLHISVYGDLRHRSVLVSRDRRRGLGIFHNAKRKEIFCISHSMIDGVGVAILQTLGREERA